MVAKISINWKWPPLVGCFTINALSEIIHVVYAIVRPSIVKEYADLNYGDQSTANVLSSAIGAVMVTMNLVLAPLGAALSERYGNRKVVILASLITFISFQLPWLLTDVTNLTGKQPLLDLICYGIGGGVTLGMIFGPSTSALQFYFEPEQRGFATGLAVTGGPFSFLTFSWLVHQITGHYSWRAMFFITGAIFLNGVAAGLTYIKPKFQNNFSKKINYYYEDQNLLSKYFSLDLFKNTSFIFTLLSAAFSFASKF